ncbi:MAG TPA: DUF2275 domain-containing protein, partial [Candidatus Binatia bacterium]|nr:DUF2275 domain-containing protein [Candidatus Binatia bacterium]
LRSLAECRRRVSTLPLVDPPKSLVTRVMAEVREEAENPSLWERLFFPLTIKLPVHAAAVVLLGILSVYLYQTDIRLKSDEGYELPTPDYRPDLPPGNEQELRKQPIMPKEPVTSKPASDAAPSPEESSRDKAAATATTSERQPQSAPAMTAKSKLEHEEKPFPSAPIPALEAAGARENAQSSADALGRSATESGTPLAQDELRSARLPPERTLRSSTDQKADYELVIRRKPAQVRDRAAPITGAGALQKRAETETSAKSVESSRVGGAASGSVASVPETLWYTVPQSRYEQFKKELSAQGSIESEIPVALKQKESETKSDRPLSIKVIILPPSANEPAAPSQPPASRR